MNQTFAFLVKAHRKCRQPSTELNSTIINSLGTSKYIQTIGKTYDAPQITLTQKAHYKTLTAVSHALAQSSSAYLRCKEPSRNRSHHSTLDIAPPLFSIGARAA